MVVPDLGRAWGPLVPRACCANRASHAFSGWRSRALQTSFMPPGPDSMAPKPHVCRKDTRAWSDYSSAGGQIRLIATYPSERPGASEVRQTADDVRAALWMLWLCYAPVAVAGEP